MKTTHTPNFLLLQLIKASALCSDTTPVDWEEIQASLEEQIESYEFDGELHLAQVLTYINIEIYDSACKRDAIPALCDVALKVLEATI